MIERCDWCGNNTEHPNHGVYYTTVGVLRNLCHRCLTFYLSTDRLPEHKVKREYSALFEKK